MKNKISNIIKSKNKRKLICLTAYSKNFAEEVDRYADITLVGDSLGSVLYNFKSTREVTIENMIQHSKSVKLGIKKSLMVVDMPYLTYKNKKEALKNAKKIFKQTKCDAIKVEGASNISSIIKHLIKNKIPVMGHLGLLPQTVRGKFRYQGKNIHERKKLIKEAILLDKLGVFSIVLECIETQTAKKITKIVKIPTIGIGSSKYCDGQVLVTDDLLGINKTKIRFVKEFINLRRYIKKGIKKFKYDVKTKKYPSKKHSY